MIHPPLADDIPPSFNCFNWSAVTGLTAVIRAMALYVESGFGTYCPTALLCWDCFYNSTTAAPLLALDYSIAPTTPRWPSLTCGLRG